MHVRPKRPNVRVVSAYYWGSRKDKSYFHLNYPCVQCLDAGDDASYKHEALFPSDSYVRARAPVDNCPQATGLDPTKKAKRVSCAIFSKQGGHTS